MAKMIRCDKCGKVVGLSDFRPITIYFCGENGLCDSRGLIHWNNEDVYKKIGADLCFDCWKDFVNKIHKYFGAEREND